MATAAKVDLPAAAPQQQPVVNQCLDHNKQKSYCATCSCLGVLASSINSQRSVHARGIHTLLADLDTWLCRLALASYAVASYAAIVCGFIVLLQRRGVRVPAEGDAGLPQGKGSRGNHPGHQGAQQHSSCDARVLPPAVQLCQHANAALGPCLSCPDAAVVVCPRHGCRPSAAWTRQQCCSAAAARFQLCSRPSCQAN